jgi:predicted transcriptional regulator
VKREHLKDAADTHVFSVKIETEVMAMLEDLAKLEDRSRGAVVRRLIREEHQRRNMAHAH